MVKKGLSCAEMQRRAGSAKKPQQRKGGAKKPQPCKGGPKKPQQRRSTIQKAGQATGNRACILKDLCSALSRFGLSIPGVLFVCDMSNQKWFFNWFKQHATKHDMWCIAVISSHGLFRQSNISEILTNKRMHVCVVGDGSCADGKLPGAHEDPRLANILTSKPGPVVLVSGDGNMDPTKSHIYDAVCIRIQWGLKTIVLASHDSIHMNLQILCDSFPGLVEIVIAHP